MSGRLLALAAIVVTAATAAPAPALAQSPRALRYACAAERYGLPTVLHFVPRPAVCGDTGQTLIDFTRDYPVQVCRQQRPGFRHPPVNWDEHGRRATGPAPIGTLRLVRTLLECAPAGRRNEAWLSLPLARSRTVCAAKRGATLRWVAPGAGCAATEFPLVLAPRRSADPPAAIDDAGTTDEDSAVTLALLRNDRGGRLVIDSIDTAGSRGSAARFGDDVRYDPSAAFDALRPGETATDTFRYVARRSFVPSEPAAVTVTVTGVDDAPVAVGDAAVTSKTQSVPIAVLANDTDVEGDPLKVSSVDTTGTNGKVAIVADGLVSYDPAGAFASLPPGQTAHDRFTYRATDGARESAPVEVDMTITGANTAPVVTTSAGTTLFTENAAPVPLDGGLTVGDPDSATLAAATVKLVNGGQPADALAFTPVGGITGAFNPATGTLSFTGAASVSDYQSALRSVTYVHTGENPSASKTVAISVDDGAITSNGANRTIAVTAVNDAPAAVNDGYMTNEDDPLTVPASGVLGNDTDVEGDTLSTLLVSGPAHGALSLSANGSLTYTPDTNFNGGDSFTYKASDGLANSNTATVIITVNAVNDAPVAVNDSYVTNEDTPLTVSASGALGNDTDVDSNTLQAGKVTDPAHGTVILNANGSFTYTPNGNYNGSDSFTYRATDGQDISNTATVTLTVDAVNDPPSAVNDSYSTNEDTPLTIGSPGLVGNDTDVDGDTLAASLIAGPAHGTLTLNATGGFTYSPDANYHGPDSFIYRATDTGGLTSAANVSINVVSVNDAPVAVNDNYATTEDTTLVIAAPGTLGNDTDADGDALTAILTGGPSHGGVSFGGDGSLLYVPDGNFSGADSFTYKTNDGHLDSNVATVNVTVNPVNDAPVAVNDSYLTLEDTPLSIAAPGILGNDTDADGDLLTAVVLTNPAHGTLTLNPNGSFSYNPNANFNGTDSFVYKVNDAQTDSNLASVNITVSPVNDAPVAVNDSYNTTADTQLVIPAPGVLGNDSDVDSNPLSVSGIVTGPAHGSLVMNGDGSFTYSPDSLYVGADSFVYKATDGSLDSNNAIVNITVNP